MIVQKKTFQFPELLLQCGQVLRNVQIGYETYGVMNERKDNVILIAHHFSGTSHAAGRYADSDLEPGYWDTLVGPGKAIDTNIWFVVSSDTLCNLNTKMPQVTTTGPASINTQTGKPYGSSFPVVTIGDFVTAQKALCDFLGIEKLHAVAGPSMGSLQALEWAARFPEMVDRVLCAIPGGMATEPYLIAMLDAWSAPIYLDSNFNGGDYYGKVEPIAGLTQALKLVTLTAVHNGWASRLYQRRHSPSKDPRKSMDAQYEVVEALEQTASARAAVSDANSFLRLCRAVQTFSILERKEHLKAKFLFLPAESDLLIYPDFAEKGIRILRELGLSVETYYIRGDGGHLDGLSEIAQANDVIRKFLL